MARRVIRGTRMVKQWDALAGIDLTLTASSTAIASGQLTNLVGAATIMRMLGRFLIIPNPGGAFVAGDECIVAFAIGIVSSDAFAAGSASVPDPNSEPDYPWLYWTSIPFHFATTTLDGSDIGASVRVAFDVKSMRRIKPRESLCAIAQYVDVAGTPPLALNVGATRVLLAGV